MIYFDNAATGGFKPSGVIETAENAMKYMNANPGRSGHRLSVLGAEYIFSARKTLSKFFNNGNVERVIFTKNCTEALNFAIFGTVKKGGNVVTTVYEHNSVLRPLYELKRRGDITLTVVEPKATVITAEDIEENLSPDTYLVVVNASSNVTGTENDIEGIGKLLKDKDIIFMVDAAQSAGHRDINMSALFIDILCVPGHKGLSGLQGSGALLFRGKAKIYPTSFGGTGTETFNEEMPDGYPERLEAGTLNLPAICAFEEGVKTISGNISYISGQLYKLSENLIMKLADKPYIKLYSIPNRVGIVSFAHAELTSQDLTEILSEKYDIAVRGGFHCAPLAHKFLKTDKFGLVRVSLAPQNTRREINALITALEEISYST